MDDVLCASAGEEKEHRAKGNNNRKTNLPPKNQPWQLMKIWDKKCCKPGFQIRIKPSIASCSPYWSSYVVYEGMDTCWLKSHFDVHSSMHYISGGCPLPDGCLDIHRLFLQNVERTSEIASLFPANSLLLSAGKPSSGHKSKPLLPLETYSISPQYRFLRGFSAFLFVEWYTTLYSNTTSYQRTKKKLKQLKRK